MAKVPATQWAALVSEQQQPPPPARATRSSSRIASGTGNQPPSGRAHKSPLKHQARISLESIWSQHDVEKAAAAAMMKIKMDHTQASNQQEHIGAATSSLAKFKAAQDLKIQTENLPQTPRAAGTSSTSSSTSTFPTPGTDTSSCATPETPAPPSSTGKKRRRRTAAQIDRKFSCNYPGCSKAYGSEGSLTQHQRLKHDGVVLPKPNKASASTPISSYFPPLHQTTRSSSGAATAASAPSSAPLPRAVARTIRPASVEGMVLPMSAFDMAMPPGSGGVLLGAASAPSSAVRPRQNQRSRSNSMPVSFSGPAPPALTKHSSTSNCVSSAARPQITRRSRASHTPRSKSGAASASGTNRRGKCRSKSETLSDGNIFTAMGDESPLPPRSSRSVSDSFVSSSHHAPFVVSMNHASSSTGASASSENVSMANDSALHHSRSFDWSPSMTSDSPSSDQAIDSDILSVLADYDSSDMDDSSTEFADGGPLSNASFRSHAASYDESDDGDMLMPPVGLESYAFEPEQPANFPTLATTGLRINDLFRRAEELGVGSRGVDLKTAFAVTKHDAWAAAPASTDKGGGSVDARLAAGYLSTHLEKMSMLQQQQQHGSPVSSAPGSLPAMSLSGRTGGLEDFASVSVDAFAVKQVSDDLEPESMEICEPDVKDEIFPLEILDDSVGVGGGNAVAGGVWKRDGNSSSVVASSVAMAPLDPGVLEGPSTVPKLEPEDLQQHLLWTKSFANASSWAALEAQNQYVDELFQEVVARGPHESKAQKLGDGPQFSAHGTQSWQGEKLVPGHVANAVSGTSLGDLLFCTSEYGLEDTRMGSPLLCQQEEL